MADYPFGTDIGLADPWASSGAGYGLLTRAVRYTSRAFDVAEGDLVVEGTYDIGESGWERNKPRFLGAVGPLRQGRPGARPDLPGHAATARRARSATARSPACSTTRAFDSQLGGSSQGIAMVDGALPDRRPAANSRRRARQPLERRLRGAAAVGERQSGRLRHLEQPVQRRLEHGPRRRRLQGLLRPARSTWCWARATRSASGRLPPAWSTWARRPPTTRASAARPTRPRSAHSA